MCDSEMLRGAMLEVVRWLRSEPVVWPTWGEQREQRKYLNEVAQKLTYIVEAGQWLADVERTHKAATASASPYKTPALSFPMIEMIRMEEF